MKHYGHIECGARAVSLDLLGRICEYYGICLEELIDGALIDASNQAKTPDEKNDRINMKIRGCSDNTIALIAEIVESITRREKE